MKKKLLLLTTFMLGIIFVLIQPISADDAEENQKKAGIMLTFDDRSIKEWYEYRALFNEYDVKATFFINGIEEVSKDDIKKLRKLQKDGHEIGSHGLNHLNSVEYVENNSIYKYLEDEITPSIAGLEKRGFKVTSFAYPFGSRSEEIDTELLKNFSIIRGTAYASKNTKLKDLDSIYYSPEKINKIIFGVGIDQSYNNSLSDIIAGIERARVEEKVMVLYGHSIGEGTNLKKYITSKDMLEGIFKYARENDLKFYTVSEMNNI